MLVTVFETVDVETRVDVSLDDLLLEMSRRVRDAERDKAWRTLGSTLDSTTKILAAIPDEMIADAPETVSCEMAKRLQAELARWTDLPISESQSKSD